MEPLALALHAMATRFELVMYGDNPVALRAAGEEALGEIERLENQLSLYRPQSEIAHVNAFAAREPVRVSPAVFSLLSHARQLWEESGHAFDVTIAPAVKCWGFMGGKGRLPSEDEIKAAWASVGMEHVELNPSDRTVYFRRAGMMIDLGAIGKGYAIDCAVSLLKDAGVTSALLHGGTSTAYAIGRPPDQPHWSLLLELPGQENATNAADRSRPVALRDASLSMSAVWGRAIEVDGKTLGHVIDPRSGRPVSNALMSVVVLPTATETDALSTALLVAGRPEFERFTRDRPDGGALLVAQGPNGTEVLSHGL